MNDRRAFLSYFSALGLGGSLLPGALYALMQEGQERVTAEMVRQAEQIAGLEFTDQERENLVRGLNGNLRNFELIRAVEIANAVPPAVQFDPVLPGMELPAERRPFRYTRERRVRRPADLESVAFWPVTRLAELVRTRQVQPSELTRMYLARLKRYGGRLEAVVSLTEERALRQAEEADRELARGRYRGPLHGIPWGAKDLLAVRGYRTTWGAAPYEQQQFEYDATVVERLDAAGAILIAKLTLGALAMGDRWYGGLTRNPWKPDEGSSGSSAGPGAATAAGLVGFSIGTETLGSIVSPSTRNGVTGLRPTFGRVSRHGAMALSWSMDKIGPMCRTVEDCALVFRAIIGPDGRDPTASRDLPFNWDPDRDPRGLRVGYYRSAFEATDREGQPYPFDRRALETMRGLVPELVPLETPSELPVNALRIILNAESAAAFDDLTRSGRDDLMEATSSWPASFRQARFIPAVEYLQANRIRTLLMRQTADIMKQVDVFITPSSLGNVLLLTNLTGHPAVVLPAGFQESGPRAGTPVSISFIGQLYGEADLLRVAKLWQDATDHHLRRPPGFEA
jgi:Asp-tRNA(Asn)/Glu-tRNA(Gln) amidotransferase A subunit family amidase/Asp-tRNA(Asn)/Glu-tRNA(Gln) amidotransferase C subunit